MFNDCNNNDDCIPITGFIRLMSLQCFTHPALNEYRTMWQLSNVDHLRQFLYAVVDDTMRQLISDVIDAFNTEVIPRESTLRQGINCNHEAIRPICAAGVTN